MDNLTIIGTSHISAESVSEVTEHIRTHKPDIVALELDHRRLHALFEEKRRGPGLGDIRRIGLQGFLFAIVGGWVQQKLGNYTGISPGGEMKTAFLEAKKHNLNVALIDQDIEITLRRFSKEFTWKEKFRMLGDAVSGAFNGKQQMKKMGINFDIEKVPEKKVIRNIMKYMKKRYPSIHKVLVEERNHAMANNLVNIMLQNPDQKILAVVGAGHEEEIEKLVESKLKSGNYHFTVSVE